MASELDTDPSLAEFAAEVTRFFTEHAVPDGDGDGPAGSGSDDLDSTAIFAELAPEDDRRQLAESKKFRAELFDAGLGWICGPTDYGGRGLDRRYQVTFDLISAGFTTPTGSFFGVGLGMIGPTILAHATASIRDRYLRGIYRGDVIACQLFSEPGAGSDLAGVSTRARRSDQGWVINGQKVWTSVAQHADIGEIIVRTDPAAAKHDGLSAFIVDMRAPGVEVRPLRQMTGGASFNEVFLTDVVVPDDHRLGEAGEGWRVALTTLGNERATVGASGEFGNRLRFLRFPRLAEMLRRSGRSDDPVLRQAIARIYSSEQIADWSAAEAMQAVRAGQAPGPGLSMAKLARTNHMREVSNFIAEVLGPDLVADGGEPHTFSWTQFLLGVPGMRIAGGSDEIQYKIIGERVLGLPKEPAIPGAGKEAAQ